MILTTNIEQREDLVEQIGERTVSRLQEMCELIPLFGDDARATYQAPRRAGSAHSAPYTPSFDARHGDRRRPVGR